ncbi:MAG: CarD family transcriptional regulator [Lachnospiraceae bacterium]|nr:CarD family transcriptional regulator [Lachnospiraceae bacterium]
MYKIGDYVVKANNGVCRIENILHPDLPGIDKNKLYYLLVPVESKHSKLYVPANAPENALRKALDEESAWEIINGIPDVEAAWIANDKLREQAYKEAIHSCDPNALISIIKNLYLRKRQRSEQGKKSTATDERYFKLAEDTLYAELAFALNKDKSEMKQLIIDTIDQKQLLTD